MTTASANHSFIPVLALYTIDGKTCIEVECKDHDEFTNLPKVVSVNGELMAKTGWNSDLGKAHFKAGCLLAKEVR